MKSPANFCLYLKEYFISIGHKNNTLMIFSKDHYDVFLTYFNESKIRWDLVKIKEETYILEPDYFNLLKGFMEIFQIKAKQYGLPLHERITLHLLSNAMHVGVYVKVSVNLNEHDGWSYAVVKE